MSIVHVRHPVSVRVVPKGARNERLAFAQAVTPVRLREVPRSALRSVARIRQRHARDWQTVHAHDGRLWLRVRDASGQRLTPQGLADLLAAGDDAAWTPQRDSGVGQAFRRTPVHAMPMVHQMGATAGDPTLLARSRRVLEDGTERARGDLARFLDGDVRIAGGAVFVRLLGPFAFFAYENDRIVDERSAIYHASTSPRAFRPWADIALVHRTRETWEYEKRCGNSNATKYFRATPRLVGFEGDLDADLIQDDDIPLFANHAPFFVLQHLPGYLKGNFAGGEAARQDILDRLAGLRPYADLGHTGAVRPDEFAAAIQGVADLVRCAYAAGVRHDSHLNRILRFAEERALPLLVGAPGIAPEDEEALTGLAVPPGGP